ncbi:antibiotic biosynthesis monooxygenase [Streptomyces albiaxialis]|uniref:Antibiotic biosynthesis monooxygenase n=1 Tax=Streptomyces albiaxialis TaxID=329523 RepID=A0ABN2X2J8_9ACTN
MTVIVAGAVYVAPEERDRFVAGHQEIVARARAHPGCLDVSISPDPLDPGRVNIYEYWDSVETLDAWRAISPVPAVSISLKSDQVLKHEVARTGPPFD